MSDQSILRAVHAEHFSHLHCTDADFERMAKQSPVQMRPGKVSIEILVRYNNGPPAWRPLNAPMGKQRLVNRYHPDGISWDKSHTSAEAKDEA